jgi:hypothetical protein
MRSVEAAYSPSSRPGTVHGCSRTPERRLPAGKSNSGSWRPSRVSSIRLPQTSPAPRNPLSAFPLRAPRTNQNANRSMFFDNGRSQPGLLLSPPFVGLWAEGGSQNGFQLPHPSGVDYLGPSAWPRPAAVVALQSRFMNRLPSGLLGNWVVNLWGVRCQRVREFLAQPHPVVETDP